MNRTQWNLLVLFATVSGFLVLGGATYGIVTDQLRFLGVAAVWAIPALVSTICVCFTISDDNVPEKTPRLSRQARKELKRREDSLLLEKKIAEAEKELGWR